MRYPFRYYIEDFLKTLDGHLADYTMNVRRRRLYQFGRIFTQLKDEGKISTENPADLTPDDIDIFVGYRKKAVNSETVLSDLSMLSQYLLFKGNDAVEVFRNLKRSHVPKKCSDRLPPMNDVMYERIIQMANDIDSDNWRMMSSYAVVILGVCGGCRAKEIRLADAKNLVFNEYGATLFLVHVKGEDTWGRPRNVPICIDGVPFLKRYMMVRSAKLESCSKTTPALIPPLTSVNPYLSYNSLRKLKHNVEVDVGFEFDLRECRRTYGQNLVDMGAEFSNVQLALGHSNPNTTYRSYCGKRPERAVTELQQLWLYQRDKELKK